MNDSRSIRKMTLLVFLAVFACYLSLSPSTIGGRGYVSEEVESGTRLLTNLNALLKIHPLSPMLWSRHGLLPVLLDLPFIKLGKYIISIDFIMSIQPVLLTAALVTLLYVWLRKITSPGISLFLALAGAFGTMLWPYAYIGLETKQSLFMLLAGYLALARGKIKSWPGLIAFAIVCGCAVTLKSSGVTLLPVVIFLVYAQFKSDWRAQWRQALVVLIVIVGFWRLNVLGQQHLWHMFGDSVQTFRVWSINSPFQFISNIVGVFGSPTKGFFLFCPILAAIIWAIPRAWRSNRDIVVYALLVMGCAAGMVSLILTPADEVWGSRYMHVAIAPLMVCIGAAWPRFEWRKHLPMAAIALLGVAISFLGAFYYYGTRTAAMGEARQNTMQWITGDIVWNEIAFNARAFSLWRHGCPSTPWTPAHIWVWEAPPGMEPWKTIDLKSYCSPQSTLLLSWNQPLEGTQQAIFGIYLFSLILGIILLVLIAVGTIQTDIL
jgi:hypothetical protein